MSDQHDYLALDWVRGEIQDTLNQAQQALETFVDNPDDSTRMRFCQTYLHQVFGTLQMVEFYGAALLAEEMEKLAQALLDGRVSQLADAHEVLMRAILQLPPYLDRVQESRRDLPLVLLPLLNDLRAARGESLLSETSLFKPDLAGGASHGEVPLSVFEDPAFPGLARKVRQMYQISLLGVIRGENLAENLGFMAKVFAKLRQVSGEASMSPLWKVAGALVEGLSLGGIHAGTSIKSVLGHLDRLLRMLAKEGASVLAKAPPPDLLKNLLYYVAKSDQEGPQIKYVRETYRLFDALPSDDLVNEERARLSGPDQAAMASVVGALSEEITKVKDALENFVHNDETDGSKLKPQSQTLKQVADTVAVLGLGQPRKLVEDQLAVIDAIAASKQPAERDVLMDVAGALLYVEATLQGLTGERRSAREGREGALAVVPDHVDKARFAVIRECRAGLEEAKDGIVEFIASQWDKSHLVDVPGKLTAVRGGLAIVLLARPAAILQRCVQYINDRLLPEDADKPDWRSMDTLADAITSVEYYLERLTDDPESSDEMLDLARKSVAQLGYEIADDEFGRSDTGKGLAAAGVSSLASEEIEMALPTPAAEQSPGSDKSAVPESAGNDETDAPASLGVDQAAEKSEQLQAEPAPPASEDSTSEAETSAPAIASASSPAASEAATPPAASLGDDDDLIDDEIIEIFVEEAGEVLEALNEYFPRWVANQSDEESLVEFRRAFHTLKGSGRMVGATVVGELAWSIENMLNRVIDKTISPTPVLIELVRAVHELIPSLVDAFARRQPTPCDVTPLSEAAFALAEGGSIDTVPAVGTLASTLQQDDAASTDSDQASKPEVPDTAGDDAAAALEGTPVSGAGDDVDDNETDEALVEIFRTESDSNLLLLEAWLGNIDADLSENPVDDTVYRAFHTLKGSARMAGVASVAELAEAAEFFARALVNQRGGLASRDDVDLISRVVTSYRRGFAASEGINIVLPDHAELLSALQNATEQQESTDKGADTHLVSVFMSAGMDLILDADQLLERWSRNPSEMGELEKLRDELALIADSADTAGLADIAELSKALERCYSALASGTIGFTGEFLDTAMRAQEALLGMMDSLAASQAIQRDQALLDALQALLDAGPDDDPEGGAAAEEIDFSDFSVDENNDDGNSAAGVDDHPDQTSGFASDADFTDSAVDGEADPELLAIFLEEADEVLGTASEALDEWEQGDDAGLAGLQRDLHTLKGGARMAGIRPIGDLAHELENLYEGFGNGQLEASAALFVLLHQCHDRLAEMLDSIADGNQASPAPELVAAIQDFIGGTADIQADISTQSDSTGDLPDTDAAETAATDADHDDTPTPLPASTVEPAALAQDTPTPEQAERDPELVEIFLEEADEILEAAGTSLESWMEAPDNLVEVQSLQRDLHTLKGGARMAEIPELGDLGHELENLYEGLAMSTLKASPVLFELLHRCHDHLAEMVEGIKQGTVLHQATELITAIHQFIADPAGFVMPTAAAQPATAVTQAEQQSAQQGEGTAVPAPAADGFVLPEDVDSDILGIFVEESGELCESLEKHLVAWQAEPDNSEHGHELVRVLHTLKGGARLANLKALGDVSHNFESALEQIDLRKAPEPELFQQMHQWQDRINELAEQLRSAFAAQATRPAAAVPAATTRAETAAPVTQQKVTRKQQAQPQEVVRIDAAVLESLVNLAGETSINRGRVEQGITEFNHYVVEMGNTIERLYEQLRRLDVETEAQIMSNYQQGLESGEFDEGFDPLEMDQYSELHQITKQLSESASDLLDLKTTLVDRTRDTETLLLQQSRINTELQERLMRTRMVPFSRLVPRLRRIVRQVSGEINKKVEFDVVNPEGELDRTLMERIVAPLEHMLRNSVDHGIEDAAARKTAGKDEAGRVSLALTREGGEVVLMLSDDGKGIDTEAVRRKAVERGLVEESANLSEQEILQFIFNAGFSTAAKVTQISGRGVGMDVVSSEIKQMGGSISINSKKGQGTGFTIRLPFTLAMNRALMVRIGEDIYAIPLNQIEGIVRISPYELENHFGADAEEFIYARQAYEMNYLGSFVHGGGLPAHLLSHQTPLPLILIRSTEHQVAILVDGLVGSREVVVKSVGPQLSTVAGISGATILGDGSVVIILDVHSLVRAAHVQRQDHALEQPLAASEQAEHQVIEETVEEPESARVPLVMVTDDSVTVRKVTSRLLERAGYEVMTAKDGVDALARLEERQPDLLLLDIEMPRMDGFEVASHVRHDSRLKGIPVIMITSRTGEKHRERAFEIGVDRYMGKPFQEGELLEAIHELLAKTGEAIGS